MISHQREVVGGEARSSHRVADGGGRLGEEGGSRCFCEGKDLSTTGKKKKNPDQKRRGFAKAQAVSPRKGPTDLLKERESRKYQQEEPYVRNASSKKGRK